MTGRLRWPEAPSEQAYRILVVGLAVGQASCRAPVRCVEFEGHTVHGHNRDFPACEPVQSIQQVLCGPPPSGKFADQDRVNLSGLCKIEQSVARGAINAGPGGRFFENADDVVTPAFREGCQFGDLSLARLVRGRNPRINCCALSQLNPLGF